MNHKSKVTKKKTNDFNVNIEEVKQKIDHIRKNLDRILSKKASNQDVSEEHPQNQEDNQDATKVRKHLMSKTLHPIKM